MFRVKFTKSSTMSTLPFAQFQNIIDLNTKYTKILEVNLFAFAYRLFHEDFSSINGTLYKSSPSSTLPLVIPEYIWIVNTKYRYTYLCQNYTKERDREEDCRCYKFPRLMFLHLHGNYTGLFRHPCSYLTLYIPIIDVCSNRRMAIPRVYCVLLRIHCVTSMLFVHAAYPIMWSLWCQGRDQVDGACHRISDILVTLWPMYMYNTVGKYAMVHPDKVKRW